MLYWAARLLGGKYIEINFNTYKNLTIRFENHTNISLFIQADSPQQAGVDLLKVQRSSGGTRCWTGRAPTWPGTTSSSGSLTSTAGIFWTTETNRLTLYLKAGAIEWPLLAISAPVLRGVTFEGSKINDNSFLYIYLKVLYPTGPKMIYKKFESCIIDQGVKLQYQKLNIIFNSEVIMSCKLSK